MADQNEINLATKEALDILAEGQDLNLFLQPPKTPEDLMARGLIDEQGTPTSKGILFTTLQESGAIDQSGVLTEKAHAYAMPYEQTLAPDNRWAFKIRANDKVDAQDASFTEAAGNVGEFLWDAGLGALKRLGYETQSEWNEALGQFNSPELDAKLNLSGTAIAEGTMKATSELGGMAEVGAGLLGRQVGKIIGMDKESEDAYWMARQDLARTQFQNQAAKTGEMLQAMAPSLQAAELVAQAKETLPADEFAAIEKQSGSFGQMIDPTILIPGAAAAKTGGKAGMLTRMAIKADSVLAKTAAIDAKIAENAARIANASRIATTAGNSAQLAAKLADDTLKRAETTGVKEIGERAAKASEIAARNSELAGLAERSAFDLTESNTRLAAERNALATRIPEHVAIKTKQAIEIGRGVLGGYEAKALGALAERVGNTLIRLDDGLQSVSERLGGRAAKALLQTSIGAAGYTVGGIPGVAAAAGILSSGKLVNSFGKFSRIVGDELMNYRGQVPFWQKVANHSELSAAHRGTAHFLDLATAGGAIPGAFRRVGGGSAKAFPMFLAFDALNNGGEIDANSLTRAAAQSLVIGGSSAALGGLFLGSKARHRELALGDEVNFRESLATDAVNQSRFDAFQPGMRRSLATYSAANPNLNFRFVESGNSSFDPASMTATINTKSTNPLKPLVAHEVLHHVAIRNQMEDGISSMLIGDGQTGGLLRGKDGSLDPGFAEFWNNYNQRMEATGGRPISANDAAVEYFIESAADRIASMAESGELGQMTGRTQARRMMSALVDSMIPKVPIIKDLHFRMGGQMDMNGNLVMGSGLLANGVREFAESRKMVREMLRKSAGRSEASIEGRVSKEAAKDKGVTIPINKGDTAALQEMSAVLQFDNDGKLKLDKDGDPMPISKETEFQRSRVGLVAKEAMQGISREKRPGEMRLENGQVTDGYLPDEAIKAIEDKGILNREQIRILKNVNSAVRRFDGSRFSVINHPAIAKTKKGKIRYETLAATLRDVMPYKINITKDGNLTVSLMSVDALNSRIMDRGKSSTGRKLYNGDTEAIRADVGAVMELHHANKLTDEYFAQKYGIENGNRYKNFINTVFGQMSEEQGKRNVSFAEENLRKDAVVRTYRLDRISKAVKMTGGVKMPFKYESVKLNLFPEGLPEPETK